jgi:hypothetical protein
MVRTMLAALAALIALTGCAIGSRGTTQVPVFVAPAQTKTDTTV